MQREERSRELKFKRQRLDLVEVNAFFKEEGSSLEKSYCRLTTVQRAQDGVAKIIQTLDVGNIRIIAETVGKKFAFKVWSKDLPPVEMEGIREAFFFEEKKSSRVAGEITRRYLHIISGNGMGVKIFPPSSYVQCSARPMVDPVVDSKPERGGLISSLKSIFV